MTDYQRDLAQIAANEDTASPGKNETTRRTYRVYQRAALTNHLDDFAAAELAIAAAFQQIGPWPDLCLIKANLDMKFHRLAEAKQALASAPGLAATFSARVIFSDIALQEGRYAEAKQMVQDLIAEDRTWDNIARLAYWESKFGEITEALRLYTEAEDEITAKEMRGYAWVQLQKGLLHLRSGNFAKAHSHYRCAAKAYSGYWLIHDHMAELLGTEGKYEEAVALYRNVLAETPRPELQQAFGELLSTMGDQAESDPWFDLALEGYLKATCNGGVHYYHHLVDFYSDVREDGPEAIRWACKDYALRQNYGTEGALAWALYRAGELDEACTFMHVALSSGVRDAHLFAKAAVVLGDLSLSQQAYNLNPHHQGFHVHRS